MLRYLFLLTVVLPFMTVSSITVLSAEPYTIPSGKTALELLDYARDTVQEYQVPPNSSHEQLIQEVIQQAKFIVDISDVALAQKPEEKLRSKIYIFKFQGLLKWTQTEDTPENVQKLEKFLDEIDTVMPNTREAKLARLLDLQRQIDIFVKKNTTKEEYGRLKKIFFSLIKREPVDFPSGLVLNFLEFADLAERQLKKKGLIDSAGKELIAMLKAEPQPIFGEMIKLVDSATRRLGQEFVLEGIALSGAKFNIKSLRGKVVLVDFFTSWCMPCIEEIPKLKEIYAKYRDKGFVIVSVGGDQPSALRDVVKEHNIPWLVISEALTVEQKLPSIEKRYGIKEYPTMFLIDKDGKLTNAMARGPRLEAALERLFLEKTP